MIKAWLDGIARHLGYLTAEDVALIRANLKSHVGAPSKLAKESPATAEPQDGMISAITLPPGYIRYFVSYSFAVRHGCGSGKGCIEIARSKPIRSYDDIQWMINSLKPIAAKSAGVREEEVNLVIYNWTRFEQDAPDGAREPKSADDEPPQQIVLRRVA